MKERPTSVTVYAILNLIMCALGVLGTIFWLIGKLGLLPVPDEKPAFQVAMESNVGFTLYTDILTAVGLLITILVIAASIGMFMLKPWARKVTIGWGIYSVVFLLINYGISYVLLYGPMLADMTGTDLVVAKAMMISGAVMSVLFIGYHLLMIFFMTRPKVVDAFTPEPYDSELDDWNNEAETEGDIL